ncbi:MAG: phosphoribosylformylglycinamidine synthase I [Candidatus Eremiobacteraeota bacterium]|nr:phosphoribosylformylglycinamidine synthase I [Candidatus Eremiobacteraeota bacterium]
MRVGVLVFPGTNSEDETQRACEAVGLFTDLIQWTASLQDVRRYDALILPGGFAYEDRVRAGAIAAHDHLIDAVRQAASDGKPVLGICNGAQILIETGLVPGFDDARHPQAAFAPNAPGGRFLCRHVTMKLNAPPARCIFTQSMQAGALIPAWHSNREGRLSASPAVLDRIVSGDHGVFVYADERGTCTPEAVPNGSRLGIAGMTNVAGNVLAVMPHPERDAWTFMHMDAAPERARGDTNAALTPSGGIALFEGLAAALHR